MYKLFLCLRYLKSRAIAYFAVVGVMLCVFMMVVVISLFTGFIDSIERAAKGLFGDVVMSADGQHGLAYYDEFIAQVQADVPEIKAAAPYILSYGMLRISGQEHYRNPVQIAGIRLPDHAEVSDFGNGLFVQGPEGLSWDPPVKQLLARLVQERQRTVELKKSMDAREHQASHGSLDIGRIENALELQGTAIGNLRNIDSNRAELVRQQARLEKALEDGVGREDVEQARAALAQALSDKAPDGRIKAMRDELTALETSVRNLEDAQWQVSMYERKTYEDPGGRMVLGLGIEALSFRTDVGDVVRLWTPGQKVVLYVFPLGTGSVNISSMAPEIGNFSVIDDSRSGVPPIDSAFVYVPFETLQKLNHMDAQNTPGGATPARCSQIIFKVKKDHPTEKELLDIKKKIEQVWLGFRKRFPNAARAGVEIETWRQRQRELLSTIEGQRIMMIIILGVVSIVAVILIFVILYVIVMQKTADIGILKAIGSSSLGVAGMFLTYGAALATLGAAIGVLFGYYVVRNINQTADWLAINFGFAPFKQGFLFDRIPDEVQLTTVVYIVVAAILAGIVGGLVPAMKAARMQPVEALRYE